MKKFQLYFFILFVILIGKSFGANTAVTVNGSGQVVNGGSITFTNLITIGALQYPLLDGTSNYVMTTDGAGHLSLQAQSGGGGGGGGITNFASNVPWLTGSGSTLAATISTNATKIPINVNTDNNAIGLTNFSASIVQTNDSVYVNALTNAFGGSGITASGTGRTRSFAVDATVVLTSRTISVTAPITGGGDLSANRTIGFDGSQTFNASGATNLNGSSILIGTFPTARYGSEVILTNTSPLSIGTGSSATTDGIAIGNYNVSSSAKSVAVGYSNTVAGTTSGIGVGFGNVTAGARGIAIGLLNTSAGSSGIGRNVAIGVSCVSTQNSSVAVGVSCNATNGGIAVGNSSAANGSSMVFGNSSFASGTSAISLGTSANSTNAGSMVVSTTTLYSSNDNQFASLFIGGYKFLGGSIEGNGFGLTTLNTTNLTGIIPTASYGAEVVQTNNAVFVDALTNAFGGTGITASGTGRTRSFAIDGTVVVTNNQVFVDAVTNVFGGSGISVSTSGRNKTVAVDASVVLTNNSVFFNAITNVVNTGSGTGLVSSVSSGIASITSLLPGANITFTRSGTTNLTIAASSSSGLTAVTNTHSIKMFLDGAGSPIVVGTKRFTYVPYTGTIIGATMVADTTGYLTVDVLKTNYPNYTVSAPSIAASALPKIVNSNKSQDFTLTGWGTSVVSNDVVGFNVTISTNCTWGELTLTVREVLP